MALDTLQAVDRGTIVPRDPDRKAGSVRFLTYGGTLCPTVILVVSPLTTER